MVRAPNRKGLCCVAKTMAGKLRFLLFACLGAALVWGVAPALSLTPYRPEAVDFTQPVPDVVELAGSGHGARRAPRPRALTAGRGPCATSRR